MNAGSPDDSPTPATTDIKPVSNLPETREEPPEGISFDRLAAAVAGAAVPTVIGRYHVIGKIGEGGMGIVLKAEQQTPVRRIVAIKIIKLGIDSKSVMARFEAEQQALAVMDHPNIARVLDAGAIDEIRPYFVMEFVPGEPITQYCDREKLSLRRRLELFRDVCSAVQHAHTKGIIHRDLKPSNVLVSVKEGQPTVKVIDFGLAKAIQGRLASQTYFTEFGQLLGTPEYMSPEQAEMNQLDIDTRTDIYGLGVMLYELLAGCLPFDSGSLRAKPFGEVQRIIREDAPRRPSTRLGTLGAGATVVAEKRQMELGQLASQLSRELEWIPLKAMRKDRTERYQTATALAEDISNYLEGRPLSAGPESGFYRTKKLILRHKKAVVASIVAVALIVAGIGIYIDGIRREQKKTESALQLADENARGLAAETKRAREETARAEENTRFAKLRFAEALVSQGDALGLAHRWGDAKANDWEAYDKFGDLHVSRFRAEAALANAHTFSPPPLLTLTGLTSQVSSVVFAADGRTAVSAGNDGALTVWDLTIGKTSRVLVPPDTTSGELTHIVISPDGHTALSGNNTDLLTLWDLTEGKKIRTLAGHVGGIAEITSIAIRNDGRYALSGSNDGALTLWNLTTGREVRSFKGDNHGPIRSIAFNPDGMMALVAGEDKVLTLWDVVDGRPIQPFKGHSYSATCVAISPDGLTALSGSQDMHVILWDLTAGTPIKTFTGHTSYITSVAFSPDGLTALSGSEEGTLKRWDLLKGTEIQTLLGHTHGIYSIAFGPGGRLALSGGADWNLNLWDLSTGRETRTLKGHAEPVASVAFSPDSRMAVSGSWDKTLKLWDIATCKEIETFSGHTDKVTSVAFNPDGHTVLSGSADTNLMLWDLRTGEKIRSLPGHKHFVFSVAISPDGLTALSGSADMTVKHWDLKTGKVIQTLAGHKQSVCSVVFGPDGRTAVSGCTDQSFKLWNLTTGMELQDFAFRPDPGVFAPLIGISVAVSPDGRTALASSSDRKLTRWDLTTGKPIQVFPLQPREVTSIAISSDGTTALSGCADETVKLWDLTTGKEVRTLNGHSNQVMSVAFSPDGRGALSGSSDSMLKFWDFSRAPAYRDAIKKVPESQAALKKNFDDPAALMVLGDWHAFRGKNDWAVELLEKARDKGAPVDSLTLGRCYWELSDDLPPGSKLTRAACLTAAKREYARALALVNDEKDEEKKRKDSFYLQLCLMAVERAMTAPPAARSGN